MCHIKNVGKLFYCATILHNFCINQGDVEREPYDPEKDRPLPPEYYEQPRMQSARGYSRMRSFMVDAIERNGMERPQRNVARNSTRNS